MHLTFSAIIILFALLERSKYSSAGTSATNVTIKWATDPQTCLQVATVVIPDGQSYTAKCGTIGFNPSDTCHHRRKRSKRGRKPGALITTQVNVISADYQLQGSTTADKNKCPDANVRDTVFAWHICKTSPTELAFPARDPLPNAGCKRSLVIKYACPRDAETGCFNGTEKPDEEDGEDEGVGLEDPHGMPTPEP